MDTRPGSHSCWCRAQLQPCLPRPGGGFVACIQVVLETCGWPSPLGMTLWPSRPVSGMNGLCSSRTHICVSDMAAWGQDAVAVVMGPSEDQGQSMVCGPALVSVIRGLLVCGWDQG